MQTYYIITQNDDIYELDATSNMSVKLSGEATEFPVEDGSVVSDHYVNKNKTISLTGAISDVKISSNPNLKSTDDYISGLESLKERVEFFSVIWRKDSSDSSSGNVGAEYILENCLFSDININQNPNRGYAYGNHSYAISMQITSLRVAEQADVVVLRSNLIDDVTSEKQNASGSTTEFGDSLKDENGKFDWGLIKFDRRAVGTFDPFSLLRNFNLSQ